MVTSTEAILRDCPGSLASAIWGPSPPKHSVQNVEHRTCAGQRRRVLVRLLWQCTWVALLPRSVTGTTLCGVAQRLLSNLQASVSRVTNLGAGDELAQVLARPSAVTTSAVAFVAALKLSYDPKWPSRSWPADLPYSDNNSDVSVFAHYPRLFRTVDHKPRGFRKMAYCLAAGGWAISWSRSSPPWSRVAYGVVITLLRTSRENQGDGLDFI